MKTDLLTEEEMFQLKLLGYTEEDILGMEIEQVGEEITYIEMEMLNLYEQGYDMDYIYDALGTNSGTSYTEMEERLYHIINCIDSKMIMGY